jgi:hypothetical protein
MHAILDEPILPIRSPKAAIRLTLASRADRLCRQLSNTSLDQATVSGDFSRHGSRQSQAGRFDRWGLVETIAAKDQQAP